MKSIGYPTTFYGEAKVRQRLIQRIYNVGNNASENSGFGHFVSQEKSIAPNFFCGCITHPLICNDIINEHVHQCGFTGGLYSNFIKTNPNLVILRSAFEQSLSKNPKFIKDSEEVINNTFNKTAQKIAELDFMRNKVSITDSDSIFYSLRTINNLDVFIECFYLHGSKTVFSIYENKTLLARDSGDFDEILYEVNQYINSRLNNFASSFSPVTVLALNLKLPNSAISENNDQFLWAITNDDAKIILV